MSCVSASPEDPPSAFGPDPLVASIIKSILPAGQGAKIQSCWCHPTIPSISATMARCLILLSLFLALASAASVTTSYFPLSLARPSSGACSPNGCSSAVVWSGRGTDRVTMEKPPRSSSTPRRTATCGISKPTTRFCTKFPHPESVYRRICLDLFRLLAS